MRTDLARRINHAEPPSAMSMCSARFRPALALNSVNFETCALMALPYGRIRKYIAQVNDFMRLIYLSLLLHVSVRVVLVLEVITILDYCPLLSSRGHP